MRTYKEPKLDKFRKPPICIPTPPEEPEECEHKSCAENSPTENSKNTLSSENSIINIVHIETENGHEDDIVDSPPTDDDHSPDVKKAKIFACDNEFEVTATEVGKTIENDIVATPNQSPCSKVVSDEEVQKIQVDSVDKVETKSNQLDSTENVEKKKEKGKSKEKVKRSPKTKKVTTKKVNEKGSGEIVKESQDVATEGDGSVKKKPQKKKLKKIPDESKTEVEAVGCDPEVDLMDTGSQEQKKKKPETDESESVDNKCTVESKSESGEIISAKNSNTPPRLKRTPKKNRKYQSDDENDNTKTTSAEGGKKNNKPPSPRKRKLNFENDKQDHMGDQIDKPSPKKKKKTVSVNKDIENDAMKQKVETNKSDLPKKKKVKDKKPKEEKSNKEIEGKESTTTASKSKPVKKKKVKKANLKDEAEAEAGKNEDSNKENDDGKDSKSKVQTEDGCVKETVTDGIEAAKEELKENTSENKVESVDTAAGDSKNDLENAESESSKQQKEKREPIPCIHCGHVAGGRAALTRHLKKCPRVNQSDDPETKELIIGPYKCEQCDYSAKKRAMLARHLTIHNTFICLRCPFVGDTRDSWQDHMKAEHKDRADQKLCKLCSRYIKCSEIPLEKHMAECKGRTPFTCATCDKEFKYESSLKSHMISHNPDEPKKFHCTSCDYESNYKANLKKHLKNLHEERVRNIQCPKCDKLFYTEDNMRRHLKLHSQDRPFVCPKCSKTFKTRASMRGHIIVHDPTRPFKCGIDECGKDFRTPKLLKNHQEEFHNLSTKRFHCSADGCNFSFFKRSHLERHEITHTGERKFVCPWVDCHRPFRHRDNLKVHMRQHTNEKPVKCDLCEFACRQRSSLHWHKKKCHPEQQSENSNSTDCTEVQSEMAERNCDPEEPELSDQKTLSPGNSQNLLDLYEFKSDEESGEDSAPSILGREKEKSSSQVDFSVVKRDDVKLESVKETFSDIGEIKPEESEKPKEEEKIIEKELEPPVVKRKKPGPKPKMKKLEEKSKVKKTPGRKKKVIVEDEKPPIQKKPGRKKKMKLEEISKKSPKKHTIHKKKKTKPSKNKEVAPPPPEPDESKHDSEKEVAEEIPEPPVEDVKHDTELAAVDNDNCSAEEEEKAIEENSTGVAETELSKDNEEVIDDANLNVNIEQETTEEPQEDLKLEAEKTDVLEDNVDNQSTIESNKSSDIESDFEDYKPPPAPRPPPICDSDEGDIESGPENEEPDSSRSFEMPPLDLSNSVKIDQPSSEKEKIPEIRSDSSEVKDDIKLPLSENADDSEVVPVPVPEAEDLQVTLLVAQDANIPPHGTTESYGEDSLSQVDKSYFDQYLPQFHHSVSQDVPEEEPKDMTLEEGEKSVEQCVLSSVASEKDLNPLSHVSAAPEELQACSPEEDPNMSHKRMEILATDREQETHFQPRAETSVPRPPERSENVYDFNSINPFMPTSRDTTILRQNDSIFTSSTSTPSFVRFSDNDSVLARQRMATPFLPQNDHNSLQNLHRIADTALSQHNNPSLLRRPTTVPPREEIFPTPPTPLPQTMTRNPFHNSWSSQEVRPPHWGQTPYLQRPIDRQTAPTSSALFSKDNYLSGRDFMFDTSCRSVSERNMFATLSSPQPQRTELPHETFQLERFDIGGYFSSHGYSTPTALDYTRPTCNSGQKSLDDRYRQTAGMTDFRTLPQTSTSDMFGSINMNSSFNLDKYVYQRDPVYHPPHVTESTNSAFLTHSLPAQHSMFERDYPPRGFYHQNNPYSFMNEKQYAAAAAASAKLTHAATVPQERDLLPRPNPGADNQMQDPYRHHSMIYNMMNRYFE
ncbi:hypothetical protein ScPMuIL_007567 [Solemya velum]